MSTFCITPRLFFRSTTSLNLDQLIRNKIKLLKSINLTIQQSKGLLTRTAPSIVNRECLYSITSTNASKYYHLNKFLIPANNHNFDLLKTSSAAVLNICTRSYSINNSSNILTQQQSLKLNYFNSLLMGGGGGSGRISTSISSLQNSSLCATIMELNLIKRSYSNKQSKINDKDDSKVANKDTTLANKVGHDDDHDDGHETTEKKLGIVGRFKQMYKQYWYVLLPVHLATSAGWLVGFYYLSKGGVDIPSLLQALSISDSIIDKLKDSTMGHLAISYMCYKIITPVRYMVTVGGTTLSINYLSKMGYIRPMPSKAQFKKMYDDRKTKMKSDFENKIESSKFWKQNDGDNEKRK